MKKTIKFFLALFALLQPMGIMAQNATNLRGDLNGDGKLDVADITTLINIIAGNEGSDHKISEHYYLVGGPGTWSAEDSSQMFSHSGLDVNDDPVFTYVMRSTGGQMWFAIGDDEALDAIEQGDWSKLFGSKEENGALSGSFDYRYNLDGDHSFTVDGSAPYYHISINARDFTYEITPYANTTELYYVVGGIQGWSDIAKTHLFSPDGFNNISYTTKWTGQWDLKIWDAANFGNWDATWGCSIDGDNSPNGTLINSNAQCIAAPSDEYYTFTINLNDMTYTWTKLDDQQPTIYASISLIGGFSNWGVDFDLAEVAPHNWHGVFTQEEDGELKLRANHDWAVNWGGIDGNWNVADVYFQKGANDGPNIIVPAGTYDVYFNDITASMMFVPQTAPQSE